MARAFIALGSNLQDPIAQVRLAIATLGTTPGLELVKASSLYETVPVGYDNQPNFINAVAAVDTHLDAPVLMQTLLNIETQFGRERPFANAPRVLDLDLLAYDDLRLDTPLLVLPHPRMHLRGFVMLPLAEIAPQFVMPVPDCAGQTALAWAAQFQSDALRVHPYS